jgi:replicative DNA helicase
MPDGMIPIFDGPRLEEPSALDAERAIIGGLMMNPKNLDRVIDIVRPEHFRYPVHARIFAEQVKRITNGGVADPLSLDDWFRSDPDAAAVGGRAFLLELATSCAAPIGLKDYAKGVVECWERRQLIAATHDLREVAYDRQTDVRTGIGGILRDLDEALTSQEVRKTLSLDEAIDLALASAEAAYKRQGPAGLSTGFPSIDEAIGGLGDDQLIVLAGRPSMGKSGLGWQMAIAAARQGVGVYVASLEMSGEELGRRALSAASGVPVNVIKKGKFHDDIRQSAAIVRAQKERRGLPLSIDDGPNQNIGQIETRARQAHRRHGLGLIMVDHLNIVPVEDRDLKAGATWAVGRVSGAMKRLAKTYHCPVLLLAQLNRGPEVREDKRPVLSDLRQAGDIEQDADVVAFVYRAEYYLPKSTPEKGNRESSADYQKRIENYLQMKEEMAGKAELILAKVRDDATCIVPLTFHGPTTSFGEAE